MNRLFALLSLKDKGNGEYCGSCPFCGGVDRFVFRPDLNPERGGSWLCRKGESAYCSSGCGDGIDLYRSLKGVGYLKAIEALGLDREKIKTTPRQKWSQRGLTGKGSSGSSTTQDTSQTLSPVRRDLWQAMAQRVFQIATEGIHLEAGIHWLHIKRFLTPRCTEYGVGFIEKTLFYDPEEWGLEPTGKKSLVIPRGILIALLRADGIKGLVVRRIDQEEIAKYGKYKEIKGGLSVPFIVGKKGGTTVLCESALDAALVYEQTNGMVAAVALNGSNKSIQTMDNAAMDMLKNAKPLLLVPDNDETGDKVAQQWQEAFPHGVIERLWKCKDIGEYHAKHFEPEILAAFRDNPDLENKFPSLLDWLRVAYIHAMGELKKAQSPLGKLDLQA